MRKFVLATLLLMALGLTLAAETKPAAVPKLTTEQKLALREAQHNLDNVNLRVANFQQQVQALSTQFQQQQTDAQKAMLDATAKAYREAGVSRDHYDLDQDKMEFVPKKPVAPAPPKQ